MIVGVDEVGRGCWAGPVVAGAVLLRQPLAGLRDSKKLSKRQRAELDILIRAKAIAYGLGWATPVEVDTLGLTAAVRLAMERAVAHISHDFTELVVDGSYNFLAADPRSKAVIKADDSVPAVSAASIIAKVARDTYMAQQAATYPGYGFDHHVGYGTARHRSALAELGHCDLHRLSFAPLRALAS